MTWLGLDGRTDEHWFGTGTSPELCSHCWEAASCPRQFAYRPEQHETLLGRLPLASPTVQQVLQQVRLWIEPAQSYEKNQLGLSQVFFNGLRLTWVMSLLADAVVLLRAVLEEVEGKVLAAAKPDEVTWVEADELWMYEGPKKRPAGCRGLLIV